MDAGRSPLQRAALRPLLALLLTIAACGPERLEKTELDLTAAVAAAEARGDTATLRLFVEVPFAFDRVYIAGPRTPEPTIAAAFRSEAWQPEFSRQIEVSDHFTLFVFETRGRLVPAAIPHRVLAVDSTLTGRMYGPETAVFRLQRRPGASAPSLLPLAPVADQAPAPPAAAPAGSPAPPPSASPVRG